MFVLSEAGKPIYSRYGSVEALSATMGVMTALVSFVQTAGDNIRAIYAGEQRSGEQNRSLDWECGRLAGHGRCVCLPACLPPSAPAASLGEPGSNSVSAPSSVWPGFCVPGIS